MKLGYRQGMDAGAVTDLADRGTLRSRRRIPPPADRPDRGIYPIVATITADGYTRISDDDLAARTQALIARRQELTTMNMPFYVAPEQVMKDRADYARKGIARGRSLVGFRFDKVSRSAPKHLVNAAQGQRDLRPDRLRWSREIQRV